MAVPSQAKTDRDNTGSFDSSTINSPLEKMMPEIDDQPALNDTDHQATDRQAIDRSCLRLETYAHRKYPNAQKASALSQVADGLWGVEQSEMYKPLLILGNVASATSDVMDLTLRVVKNLLNAQGIDAPSWRPGWPDQSRIYDQSANAIGFKPLAFDDENANLMASLNPNPMRQYAHPEALLKSFQQLTPGSFVIVDESGNGWNPDVDRESLTHFREELRALSEKKFVHVFVISSWTKLFEGFLGARISTCIAPTESMADEIRRQS